MKPAPAVDRVTPEAVTEDCLACLFCVAKDEENGQQLADPRMVDLLGELCK